MRATMAAFLNCVIASSAWRTSTALVLVASTPNVIFHDRNNAQVATPKSKKQVKLKT